MNQFQFNQDKNLLLQVINAAIILIVFWIIVEGVIKLFKPEAELAAEVSAEN